MRTLPARWSLLPLLSLAACSLSTSDYTFDAGQAGAASGGSSGAGTAGQPAGGAGQAGQSVGGAGQAGQQTGGAGQAGQQAGGAGQGGQQAGGAGQAGSGGCAAGEKRCNGADIEGCVGGVFKKESSCEAPQTCSPIGGVPACTSCKPDEGKCSGATLLRCSADGASQALVGVCNGATAICDEKGNGGKGECDKCASDAFQCVGAMLFKCSATGQDLVLSKDCGSDTLCDAAAGGCKTEVCKAGERRCDGDKPMVCDTSKNQFVQDGADCAPGLCNPASKMCFGCAAGTYRCDSDALQQCPTDGSAWTTITQCPAGKCDASAKTCTECSPGSRICAGQTIVECAGGSFTPGSPQQTCKVGQICDAASNQCDVCQPNATRCDGADVKRCSPDGQTETISQTCASAALCDAVTGACRACVAGEIRCTGATLEECAADGGGWVTKQKCASAALCDATSQACVKPTCAAGEIVCGTGNQVGQCNADQTGYDYSACDAAELCVAGSGCAHPISVSVGSIHACATFKGGSVACWGGNTGFQTGSGASGYLPPTVVKQASGEGLASVTMVSAAAIHTCALVKSDVYCWGANNWGQLGTGAVGSNTPTPQRVSLPRSATMVVAGGNSSCAVLDDGSTWCWGRNDNGQLGVGDQATHPSPTELSKLPLFPTELSLGGLTSCAAAPGSLGNSEIHCWGGNQHGQAGQPLGSGPFTFPELVPGFTASHVTVGQTTNAVTCAHSGGKISCWGSNAAGELGRGSTGAATPTPGFVTGVSKSQVSTGDTCTCAAGEDVLCWGNCAPELAGQTAGGPFPSPTLVPGSTKVTDISVGSTSACGFSSLGTLVCWGQNDKLQLGSPGTSATSPRPVVFP